MVEASGRQPGITWGKRVWQEELVKNYNISDMCSHFMKIQNRLQILLDEVLRDNLLCLINHKEVGHRNELGNLQGMPNFSKNIQTY